MTYFNKLGTKVKGKTQQTTTEFCFIRAIVLKTCCADILGTGCQMVAKIAY